MSKSRDIADSAATINYIDTVTSNVQTQLNTATAAIAANTSAISNISVTNGSLTKTFTNGETASISLTSNVLVPVVSVTKEVPQSGATNNTWDVNSTTENYTRLNSAPATTLSWMGDSISGATYASQSFNALSVLGGNVCDVAFKPDGLKMFLCAGTGIIYEYALSTAFDVSSASYSNTNGNISSQTPALTGISFSASGAKMYAIGTTNRTIYEFNLSTPWSVVSGSLSYSGNSFSIASKETGPTGVTLNPLGTKVYIIGYASDSVHEFALSTPFDISSASFTSSFSVASQETSPQALQFNSDGTLMFICGGNSDKVHAYNLSSAYDISSSVYNSAFLSTASEMATPMGFAFDPTGSKLAVFGNNSIVYGYTLPLALSLGSGSFASADVGKTIEANSGVFVLTAATGSYVQTTTPTSFNQVASGSWGMFGVVYNTTDGDLELSHYIGGYYDIANSAYSNNSLTVSYGNTTGTFISSDGTKLYILGESNEIVLQYALSTPFDASSGTFVYGLNIAPQGSVWRDLTFNNDGTKMYLCDESNIFTFALATPWVISSTANPVNRGFPTTNTIQGFCFNSDGSKLYTVSSGNRRVYENNLSAPFNPQFGITETTNFFVGSQTTNPRGIRFNSDGTKMFIMGKAGITGVIQYDLSSAFVVSPASASYNGVSFNVQSQENDPEGFVFNTDGSKMYVIGEDSTVYEYGTLSFGFPTGYQPVHTTASTDTEYWTDINSMTANQAAGDGNVYYAISTDDRTTWSVIDNTDGERDIVRNNSGTWQYNSNGTYASETWVNGATNTELATIAESMEGASAVAQKYNISTAVFVDNFSVNSQDTSPYGFSFSSTGHKMYVVGITNDSVYEYALSTVFDVSTASYTASFSVAAQDTLPTDVVLSTDGTKMFVLGDTGNDVNEYSLSNAYDVSSASFVDSFSVAAQESDPWGLAFNPTGTKMFVLGYGTDTVREYTLSNGFDVSTASYSQGFSVAAQDTIVTGVDFSADGTQMFVLGNQTRDIFQYSLSAGFDVSTASYVRTFEVNIAGVAKVRMNNDGTKMFTINYSSKNVGEYTVGTTAYINQMNKTQLDAVTDPNHIALDDDFDLSIILNMTSGTTVPSSNGVAINYDANVLNKGAVLGTDYDFDAPAQNKIRITALAANNLKVRVV